MRLKYYIFAGLAAAVVVLVWFFFFRDSGISMKKFSAYGARGVAMQVEGGDSESSLPHLTAYCPAVEELIKVDTKWITKDEKWENNTPSSANRIVSFVGAQWVGVKYGQIICLYKTDEAVTFPFPLEQISSQLILEPTGGGWGALVGNRRFCKSANTADCPYAVKQQENPKDVYEKIKYAPKRSD